MNVLRFPERRRSDDELADSGAELATRVTAEPSVPIEGELVDDNAGSARPPIYAVARRIARPVVSVARDDRTRHVARHGARHLVAVAQGFASWGKRAWDATTMGVYRRQIRLAEQSGDKAELKDWLDRKEAAAEARHQRLQELPKIARGIALVVVIVAAAFGGVVLLAQLVGGELKTIVFGVLGVLSWLLKVVAWAWGALLVLALVLVLVAAWREGRRHGVMPAALRTPAERRADTDFITPAIVVKALRDLGIAELRKRIDAMEDGGAGMLGPIVNAGRGVEVDVLLPSGISTGDIKEPRRRQKLAENLGRHEHELFITVPRQARALTLWIADPGALSEPIEPSPLVTNPPGRVSMAREPAPWGKDLRDSVVAINLWQKHLLITGLSNMGKTAALRALALWLLFDPTVELRCADLKGIGDWDPLKGFFTTYIKGPTDEHVADATVMLEDGVEEMNSRLQSFDSDRHPNGVPEGLLGYHPLVLIVDEAQVAYMSPARDKHKVPYGGKANNSRFLSAVRKIQNQGRAVNVLLWQGTQNPTDMNFPKLARDGAHIRASLKVSDEKQARMAVGDEAANAGAAPHELRPENKGVVVVTGDGVPTQPGQSSVTVFTHFINGTDAAQVAERAAEVRQWATTVEVGEPVRDLLEDVLEVLGGEDERAPQVARRLRDLASTYARLSGEALVDLLRDAGVSVRLKDGSPMVRVREVEAVHRENGPDQG